MPVAIKERSVVLEVSGVRQEIANHYVWIFAGGEPPTAFLKKIGVEMGMRDMTDEGSGEAKEAAQSRKQLAAAGFAATGSA